MMMDFYNFAGSIDQKEALFFGYHGHFVQDKFLRTQCICTYR